MRRFLTTVMVGVVLALVLTLPALAHERRPVGKYQLVVGFLNEPPVEGQMNGLDLTITSADTKQPVEGAEKTLKVEVNAGGKTQPLQLQARFQQPGKYAAYFIPTKAGDYRFILTGNIEGQTVNETFESGPGRFDAVASSASMQFPEKAPDAAALTQQLADARSAAATATTLGIAGIVVGVLGLAVGAWALMTRRTPKPANRSAVETKLETE